MHFKSKTARLLIGMAAALSMATAAAATRPNVVFLLADDLGYGDLAAHGNPHVTTPQLDRFATDAVAFSRYYTAPVCNPTRAALMTGRYTFRTFAKSDINMHPAEVTIAEMLRPAGYQTALFGKWHLGDGPDENPLAQGFEEVVTFTKGALRPDNYFDPVLIHNGKEQKYQGYCMDVFTDLAIDFIKKHRDQPFFVYLPANLIHTPIIPPRGGEEPFLKMGMAAGQAKLYAMIKSTDDNFGRLRAALKELGLEDNTLLIFASDNGPSIYPDGKKQFNRARLGNLRGMKGNVYEGGIRVPCFMSWPNQFKGGKKVERPIAHIDVLPTILDACGVAPAKDVRLDGKSVLPLLRDPTAAWPDRTLFIQWDSNNAPRREHCFAAITDNWKLVQPCGMTTTGPIKGALKQYEKLCRDLGYPQQKLSTNKLRFELYNIAADPGEDKDLAAENPAMAAKLRKEYNSWLDQITATARWEKSSSSKNQQEEED